MTVETDHVFVAWPNGWNDMHHTFDNVFANLEDAIAWINQYGDETYTDWHPEAQTNTEVHHHPKLEDGQPIQMQEDAIPMVVETVLRHNLTDEYRIIPTQGVRT